MIRKINPLNWVNAPALEFDCPPGYENLSGVDKLFLRKKGRHGILGYAKTKRYIVYNNLGQKVYLAEEISGRCGRGCLGRYRNFDLNIIDRSGNAVMIFKHPARSLKCYWCFGCCLYNFEKVTITSLLSDTVTGVVKEKQNIRYPLFEIKNENNEVSCYIKGPWQRTCLGSRNFIIFSANDNKEIGSIGKIHKNWPEITEEHDDTDLGVSFPVELDVKIKASLLGALFLINVMYFEEIDLSIFCGATPLARLVGQVRL